MAERDIEGWQWRWERREGDVVEHIQRVAEEIDAVLVSIMAQGHHGFTDALRGSTTEQVLQRVPCVMLAVPAGKIQPTGVPARV